MQGLYHPVERLQYQEGLFSGTHPLGTHVWWVPRHRSPSPGKSIDRSDRERHCLESFAEVAGL